MPDLETAERERAEALVIQAQDYARAESERAEQLVTLARDILSRFTATGEGHRARVGQVQISKWERILQQLEDAAGDLADPASDPAEAAFAAGRAAERELLAEADAALWACAKAFLTVEPTLKTPYRDAPEWSPWTRWCERPARTAHDMHVKIRKHLKAAPEGDPQ